MSKDPTVQRKIPSQRRAISTVEKVLNGTRQLLREQGADAITTRNISKITGISPGSIYQYFGNKEQILFTLYDERLKQSVAAFHSVTTEEKLALPLRQFWSELSDSLASVGWGNAEDNELNKAIAENPLLQKAVKDTLNELYDCLVKIMRHYGSSWSDEQLRHLAEYAFGINHLGYTLRLRQHAYQQQLTSSLTNELEFYLMTKAINEPAPDVEQPQ